MCGIAGILRFDERPIDPARLDAMTDQLRHRGPDGSGVSLHGRCALAHTRLSIIDLLSGQQPMHLEAAQDTHEKTSGGSVEALGGGLHLVFNGEIYNHRPLRQKLEKRGHVFKSNNSDTEALLFGYRQWGDSLPRHLHGMFAFAVYDERDGSLFIARDRVGKKPLYLHQSADGKELRFASLVATLYQSFNANQRPGIDSASLLHFLRLGYPFADSMLEGVTELPAGHSMRIDAQGNTTIKRYWQPPPISRTSTRIGVIDSLEEVLTEAVIGRLQADVPLGAFLSGGIDSSLVCAIAQQRLKDIGSDALRTYSVKMPDVSYDESPYAAAVAKHIGAQHTVLDTPVGDAMSDLRRLMAVSGEPTADSSLLPTHWLCKAARPFCKAAISGDGGDELFGGYDRYRAMRLLTRHGGWLAHLPGALFKSARPGAKSRRTRFGRLVAAAKAGRDPSARYRSMIHLFADDDIAALMPDEFGNLPGDQIAPLSDWPEWNDVAHAAMRWDFHHYLPYELLRKVDRASMAVALEVRCPLLDTQVCDLACHLPTPVLMPGGRPKALLRDLSKKYLPSHIVDRPKRGFAVPIGGWFRDRLKDELHAELTSGRLETLGIDPAQPQRYFNEHLAQTHDHTHRLFALLQLSLWVEWMQNPTHPNVGIA